MTVNSSTTFEFTISQIVLLAYRKAGLLNVYEQLDDERAGAGRLELETLIDELQTEGQLAKVQDFYNMTLTAGTAEYSFPDNVLHPIGNAMYIAPGQTVSAASSERIVIQIDLQTWHENSNKSAQSPPDRYAVYRAASAVKARFLPVPSEAGTVRFRVNRLRADSSDGSKTPDFERYWSQALVWGLAYQLATSSSLPLGRVAHLKQQYETYVEKAKGHAREQASWTMVVEHSTPWSR